MQVRHSIYLGQAVELAALLDAIEEHNVPRTAELDWNYGQDAVMLVWTD